MFGMEPEDLDLIEDDDDNEIPWWVSIVFVLMMLAAVFVGAMLIGPGSYGGP